MLLILAAVLAFAVFPAACRIAVCYRVAAILIYLAFLGLVRIWVSYVTRSGIQLSKSAGDNAADFALNSDLGYLSGSSASTPAEVVQFGGGSSGGAGDESERRKLAAVIVLGILLAVILGAGAYLICIAPELLSEVAVQVVMASALKRASDRLAVQGDWALSVLNGAIVPFLVVLAVTIAELSGSVMTGG